MTKKNKKTKKQRTRKRKKVKKRVLGRDNIIKKKTRKVHVIDKEK